MGKHQSHIQDNNNNDTNENSVQQSKDNCNSFEVREDKEPGYVCIERVSSQRDWVQKSQRETNDTETDASEIDGNVHSEGESNDTETDDSQIEDQQLLEATTNSRTSQSSDNEIPEIGNEQLLEATTNSRTSQSSDNEIPEIGNEQLLEAATSFKTSQSNGNNIPEIDGYVRNEGGSNDTEKEDSQIDHPTMHSPPPVGADIGVPSFSCSYPIQVLTAINAVILLEDCKFKSSKNWETLTARLKVPKDERTKQKQQIMIDGNYTGALEELLDFWILNSDHPTWQKLISAVEFYERRTAESMRKKLGIISEECRVKLQRICEDSMLRKLSIRIPDFTAVAPFFITKADIEDIEKTFPLSNDDKIQAMLWKWRERDSQCATYLSLIHIFREIKMDNLAEFVQENIHVEDILLEVDFPFKKNETELYQLECYNKKIRNKFQSMERQILKSLLKRKVQPTELKIFLKNFVGRCKEIHDAEDLDKIFLALCYHQSWFNFEIYEDMIEEFGGEEEKETLENYKHELKIYLKKSLIEIPNPIQLLHDSRNQTLFVLKIPDDKEGQPSLSGGDVQKIKRDLALQLNIPFQSLSFCEYRLGCIELVFSAQTALIECNKSETPYIIWDQTKEEYKFSTDPDSILASCTRDRDEKLFQQNSDEGQSLSASTGSKTDPDASLLSYSFGNVEQ